jgi:branched-chain amino acid transport system substrate-binding protein
MKRFLPLVILLLILSLTIVACGGDDEEPTAEETTAEEAVEEPTEEPVEEPTEAPAEELVCDDAIGCVKIEPGDPILLASALVISGPNTQLGQDSQRGVEIALDYRGEVLGHAVELQPEDDGCNAEGGQASAQKIVSNPQIVAAPVLACPRPRSYPTMDTPWYHHPIRRLFLQILMPPGVQVTCARLIMIAFRARRWPISSITC